MLRTGIPFTTWLDQPDGVIETALQMLHEQDVGDVEPDQPDPDGPQMSG